MWHEARKQEKKIRGMMVDYRKRAERRRDFYEKFKADPTQFLQLHGRPCKVHLDPAIAVAGDAASVMMPWQGHPDVLIDRFDVRAHLDTIPEVQQSKNEEVLSYEERTMNYERYRILVQNEFLGVNEEKFLHQIYLEEQFGPIALKQSSEMLEKEKRKKGVAIGFNYEDSTPELPVGGSLDKKKDDMGDKDGSDSDDSDLDFDLCLDLSQIDTPNAHELNSVGQRFGLTGNDFFSFLTNDVEEQEAMRLARQQEEEKAMFSGRKARRERQAFREKKLIGRVMSPPSYAARKSPTYDSYRCNKSLSRSTSPENAGQITYITSFGGEDSNDEKSEEKFSVSKSLKKTKKRGSVERGEKQSKSSSHRLRRSKSLGSRSRSKSPKRRRRQSRSRSMENRSLASNLKKLISKRNERRSRSESSDKFRSYSKWRSRSRSRSRRRSWSSRSRSDSRSRSRSRRSRSASSDKKQTHSRSNSSKSRSRSRSTSRDKSKSRKRMESSSSSSRSADSPKRQESPPKITVPRYYGRNRKDSSSSLSLDSSDTDSKTNFNPQPSSSNSNRNNVKKNSLDDYSSGGRSAGNARPTSKQMPKERPQEKLKKKMQALLNKQFRADKKAEKERMEKAEQERQDREAELRDIAIKIRRRERYLRHRGEDEENDGEREALRRRERYLRRSEEEDGKREKRDGDGWSQSSGSDKSKSRSPESKSRRSRSPRRSKRSRSASPKTSKLGKRTLVDY